MRKRWTGLATTVALVASLLAVNSVVGAKADDTPGQPWTLYAAGDVADPNSGADEMNAALIKAGIAADPDRTKVMMLGDGAYPDGSYDTYVREYGKAGSWGDFKDKTYPVPGNHDYGRNMDTTNAGYRQYWQERLEPLGAASGGNTMGDDGGWYSFDLGNWHVIALNWACGDQTKVLCGVDGPQGRWLQADLDKAKAANKHIIAMWHGARFFSQNDNGPRVPNDFAGPSTDAGKTNPYWRMLQAAGADIVLGAHQHSYERFARMSVEETDLGKQGSIDPNGMRQFVVGTGGGDLMKFTDFAPARGSEARVDNAFGVLKLVLRENSYEWQFLSSGSPGEPPAGTVLDSGSDVTHSTLPGSDGTTSTTTGGSGGTAPTTSTTAPSNPAPGSGAGYWMVGSDGKVFPFGAAQKFGDAGITPGSQAVDLEPTPSGNGYWVVDDAGGVARFGDALYYGAPDSLTLKGDEKVTSLSSTKSGNGYWMFTNKGRVLAFGDAKHYGDMSGKALNAPVLDSIVTSSGLGYYMVAADGGIFSFGDAKFYGSMGNVKLNKPVQSLVPDADGVGYWLVASDGGIFAFDAPFKGSLGSVKLNRPVTGMVRYADGYLMVGEDGGIFNFSNKQFLGSLGGNPPARPIVSVAALG